MKAIIAALIAALAVVAGSSAALAGEPHPAPNSHCSPLGARAVYHGWAMRCERYHSQQIWRIIGRV